MGDMTPTKDMTMKDITKITESGDYGAWGAYYEVDIPPGDGGAVRINGATKISILRCGGDVYITDEIEGDIYVAHAADGGPCVGGSLYVHGTLGGSVNVQGMVQGDLIVSGTVRMDVAIGCSPTHHSTPGGGVGGNVRLHGAIGTVEIHAPISRTLELSGSVRRHIVVSTAATVGGNLVVRGSANYLVVASPIDGDVDVDIRMDGTYRSQLDVAVGGGRTTIDAVIDRPSIVCIAARDGSHGIEGKLAGEIHYSSTRSKPQL